MKECTVVPGRVLTGQALVVDAESHSRSCQVSPLLTILSTLLSDLFSFSSTTNSIGAFNMDSSTASSLTSTSPLAVSRRICSKTSSGEKTHTGHTRSPRSRYSLTYADWITRALMAAKDKCACLSDIYEWMSFNVPGLQEQRFLHSSKGWKNAVRHTLSINPRFQKLKRLGKPALWTLSEEYLRQAQALTKISMSIGPRTGESSQLHNSTLDTLASSVSPESKICFSGQPSQSHQANLGVDMKLDSAFNPTALGLAQEAYRQHSALLHDQYRNQSFLPTGPSATPVGPNLPTLGLNQNSDNAASAAVANRAAFLSELSALASLNALVAVNGESRDSVDHMRQRFSAETAALAAAAAAAHGLGAIPSTVATTPPLMNFFSPSANCPFSISRRGSGDSGISSISSNGGSTNVSSSMGPTNTVESLRPFTQVLDVTTLSGMEATLVFPRPLPIQCLTDHKLLLASLIWPNPTSMYMNN